MSYFSHTADFGWNQGCIVDLKKLKNFQFGGCRGGGELLKIRSLWYNLTKKVVFLPVVGFGIFGPHKILGEPPNRQGTECTS